MNDELRKALVNTHSWILFLWINDSIERQWTIGESQREMFSPNKRIYRKPATKQYRRVRRVIRVF